MLSCFVSGALLLGLAHAQQPAAPQPARLAGQTLLLDYAEMGGQTCAVGDRGTILVDGEHMASPSRSLLTGIALRKLGKGREAWVVGHDKTILRLGSSGSGKAKKPEWKLEAYDTGEREDIPVRWTLLDIHWFDRKTGIDVVQTSIDPRSGMIVGSYGLIMRTSNAGKTWSTGRITWDNFVDEKDIAPDDFETLPDSNEIHLYKLRQGPDGTLFCAADEGNVFRSTDEGKTWAKPDTGQFGAFYDVLPVDDKTILAVGILGTIIRSADGGSSWQKVATETRSILHALVRADDGTIYALGDGGTRLKSTDVGRSFSSDNIAERVAITGGNPDAKDGGFLLTEKGLRPW